MFDDWHDFLRVAAMVLSLLSLWLLARRFASYNKSWSPKTKDLWFALVMWCAAAIALAIEGLVEDRPLEPRLVFYSIATLVTFKGVYRKGSWGGKDEKLPRTV